MSIQKFQVKLYVEAGGALDIEKVIPVFHSFIREKKVPEMVIDVADYGHVVDGPGVVLIGHASDYYLELREGRVGLNYSRKRDFVGDADEALASAVKSALTVARLLEDEDGLGVRFVLDDVLVRVNDRLRASNDDASYEALRATIATVLGKALGADLTLSREGEPRELLTIRARGGKGSVNDALARLG